SGRLGTAGIVTDYTGAVTRDELHYPWGQEWTGTGTMMEERFASLNHRDSATFAPGLFAQAMRRAPRGRGRESF
ncbi:MAG: hypothetical protein KGM47_00860, partial [Acidobacteriota bacterium]|nr:hypothetical protein [Acidobacteriota bacterium]